MNTKEDHVQLVKLENVLALALHLREVAEDFQRKKVRDTQDFEWVRNPRYLHIQKPTEPGNAGEMLVPD